MTKVFSIQNFSVSDIQKYNGKSVKINDFSEFLFDDRNLIVIFKTAAIKASDERKFRIFLKKNGIIMKRFKKKNLVFFERFFNHLGSFHGPFLDFISVIQGSCTMLVFHDVQHFFFFEKYINSKISKFKFFPFLLKTNNSYHLVNSSNLNNLIKVINESETNLARLDFFFYFQLFAIRNFLYILINFKFQFLIYNSILNNNKSNII